MKYLTYCIKNNINGKMYIGITKNFKQRISKHFTLLKNNKHENEHLQSSYNIYGKESFEVIILIDGLEREKVMETEKLYINKFKTYNNQYGYNLTFGGECWKPTKQAIENYKKANIHRCISISQYDKNGNFIKRFIGMREASRELNISTIRIRSAIKNLSLVNKRWMFSKKHEEKLNPYIRKHMKNAVKIKQFDLNGTLIKIWNSAEEIQRETGYKACNIRNSYTTGQLSNGFIWKRFNDEFIKPRKRGLSISKPLVQKKDNIIIKEFDSMTELANELKTNVTQVGRIIRKNKEYKGYKFEFKS